MPEIVLYDHRSSICSQMARLALIEKYVPFRRRSVDIMDRQEQFEPWYIALNPRAVVPTLAIGDEIVTDTIRIVNRVQEFDGPDLSGGPRTQQWLRNIMSLHYGVLLYRNRLDADGTAQQIVARGEFLSQLATERPDLKKTVDARLEGNRRFQALLKDPEGIARHLDATRNLIRRMIEATRSSPFLSGDRYSLADCFATAVLARFTIHRLDDWWADTALEDYYRRMRSRPSFRDAEVVETGHERDL